MRGGEKEAREREGERGRESEGGRERREGERSERGRGRERREREGDREKRAKCHFLGKVIHVIGGHVCSPAAPMAEGLGFRVHG